MIKSGMSMNRQDFEDYATEHGGLRCPENCGCGGSIGVTTPCCGSELMIVSYAGNGELILRCGRCRSKRTSLTLFLADGKRN